MLCINSINFVYITGDVYTSVRLDRERQKEYLLIVEVDDQGVPGSLQVKQKFKFLFGFVGLLCLHCSLYYFCSI